MKLCQRFLSYLLLFFLIFIPASTAVAANNKNQKVVRVGYFTAPKFQEGGSDNAYKDGYAYEYLTKIKYFTNWKYKYVYGSWTSLLEKLKRGEIDIMAGISYSKERAEYMLFPEESMGSGIYYVYAKNGNSDIIATDPSSLNGKRVGAVRTSIMSSVLEKYIEQHKLNVNIIYFDDFSTCEKAFADNAVDCAVFTGNSASANDNMIPVIKLASYPDYLVFSKSRHDLLEEYNKAVIRISETDPYFTQNLEYFYFNDNAASNSMSPLERQWIKNHKTIRVGYLEDYLPYSGTSQRGKVTGIITNVVKEICRRLHIDNSNNVQFVGFSNYDSMTHSLKSGDVDAVFPVGGNSWNAEQEGIIVSNPVVSSNMTLVFRHEFNANTERRIAVNRNNLMQLNYTKSSYPKAEIIFFNSIDECLKAVNEGKANSTIVNGMRVMSLLSGSDYAGLSYITLAKLDTRCFGFKTGNDSTLTLINRGLKLIGADFGKNATHEYATSEYTFMDFVRDNVLAIASFILLIGVIIVVLVSYNHQRTKALLNLVSRRNADLEEAQQEAEYANSAKTKFLNSMSHDIRTPMNAIIGFTDLAKNRTNEPPVISDYLQKISVSSNHLLSLINEILDMSRIESGQIQLNQEEMSLSEQINNLRIITEEGATEKGIDISFNSQNIIDDNVVADKLRLCQILINIIGNAVKYTERGGWIKVTVKQENNIDNHATYTFSVKDNGIGMTKDFQEHIFEAFTRERTSTVSNIQGTGLGMAITKRLVNMMDGNIEVHSELGKGSEFIITLTLQVAESKAKAIESTSTDSEELFHGRRILVVEDNEMNQEIATLVLEEMGFTTEVAANGQLAFDAVTSHPSLYYDAILMDIQMPVMNGYDATRAIRALADKSKADIPIIAMTANAFDEDKRAAFDAGMNAHIAKPIDTAKLKAELHKVLTVQTTK